MDLDPSPSPSQLSFEDFDFDMSYEDYKTVKSYVTSKLGLLTGSEYSSDTPRTLQMGADASPVPRANEAGYSGLPPSWEPAHETSPSMFYTLDSIPGISEQERQVLDQAMDFMVDLSDNGVNGHRVGTILVIGDTQSLFDNTVDSVPNPLRGYSSQMRSIFDRTFRRSLAQFSQFDGCIGMSQNGCVDFCGRLISHTKDLGEMPEEIQGRGARHQAGWAISKLVPGSISIILSQDGDILVLKGGAVISKIVRRQYTTKINMSPRTIFSYDDHSEPT
jgi:hypothetical protein